MDLFTLLAAGLMTGVGVFVIAFILLDAAIGVVTSRGNRR
jgi:hypothetical protein